MNKLYKVPRPDSFTGDEQLHSGIIMDLREEWKCEEHDTNVCYKKDDEHFPLNHWKMKVWATALVCWLCIFSFIILIFVKAASQPGISMREPSPTLFQPEDAVRSRS